MRREYRGNRMGEVMKMMNYSLRVLLILRTPVMIIMTEVVGYYLLRKVRAE